MIKAIKFALKDLYLLVTRNFYFGDRLECPICQLSFSRMKPHRGVYSINGVMIDHYTEDAHCPSCNLDIRHRLFYQEFLSELNQSSYSVLHFAPERRIYKNLRKLNLNEYIVADLNPDLYRDALPIDATNIPFADMKFDFIIFNHILQFIADDKKALSELYRVLKPDGKLYLTIPIYDNTTVDGTTLSPHERELQFGAPEHLRMYGHDIKVRLKEMGFKVHQVDLYEGHAAIFNSSKPSPHSDSDRFLLICKRTGENN